MAGFDWSIFFFIFLIENGLETSDVPNRTAFAPRAGILQTAIIQQCRLHDKVRPLLADDEPVVVTVGLEPFSFQGFDDNTQTMSLIATVNVRWLNPCTNWESDPKWNYVSRFTQPLSMVWTPELLHANSVKEVSLQRTGSKNLVRFTSKGDVQWKQPLFMVNQCNLKFDRFPFDYQTCTVDIWTDENIEHLRLFLHDPPIINLNGNSFTNENDLWSFVEVTPENYTTRPPEGLSRMYDRTAFSFTFKRRYKVFVSSLFFPTYVLFLMQIGSGLMPPDMPDRPAFCITNALAYFILLATMDNLLPLTPNTPYLTILLGNHLATGCACTLYALLACGLAQQKRLCEKKSLPVLRCRVTLIRLIDIAFYPCLCIITLLIDASLLAVMIS